MMAETWRNMKSEEKEKYKAAENTLETELSAMEKKKLAYRIAKRYQGDVNVMYINFWGKLEVYSPPPPWILFAGILLKHSIKTLPP